MFFVASVGDKEQGVVLKIDSGDTKLQSEDYTCDRNVFEVFNIVANFIQVFPVNSSTANCLEIMSESTPLDPQKVPFG